MKRRRGNAPSRNSTDRKPVTSIIELYRESAYARFDQEHRTGGSFELEMIEVGQGAIDTIDPPNTQVQFIAMDVGSPAPCEFDVGDGWRQLVATRRTIEIQPALQACGLKLPALDLRLLGVDKRRLDVLLAEVGAPAGALDAVTGMCREIPRARRLHDALWESTGGNGGPANALRTDGLFMTFVGEMLEACGKGRLELPLPRPADRRLVRAIDYVETYLDHDLSVDELARVATMSRSTLARAFRASTGEAVWAYVRRRRAERARELLATTTLPIAEVARRCGFASQPHLTRVFKAVFGITPGSVRRSR